MVNRSIWQIFPEKKLRSLSAGAGANVSPTSEGAARPLGRLWKVVIRGFALEKVRAQIFHHSPASEKSETDNFVLHNLHSMHHTHTAYHFDSMAFVHKIP